MTFEQLAFATIPLSLLKINIVAPLPHPLSNSNFHPQSSNTNPPHAEEKKRSLLSWLGFKWTPRGKKQISCIGAGIEPFVAFFDHIYSRSHIRFKPHSRYKLFGEDDDVLRRKKLSDLRGRSLDYSDSSKEQKWPRALGGKRDGILGQWGEAK